MIPNIPKTAMVFAAGLGMRMRPITLKIPKPLVEICGKPLIDYRLDKLVEAGVERAVVNTYHLAEMLEDYLSRRDDIEIIISREETLLETGGGLVKALPYLGKEPFYIINSDIIWIDNGKPALVRLAEKWDGANMDMLLLLHPKEKATGYHGGGDFDLKANGQLKRTEEKEHKFVYTGVQIFHPRLLEGFKPKPFSLAQFWFNARQQDSSLHRMYGITHTGEWLHVDSEDGIIMAEGKIRQ